MTHGDWPALEGIDWPRRYATKADYPDEFGEVRVLNPEEAQQVRARELDISQQVGDAIRRESLYREDDGARLKTPEAHRRQAIDEIETATHAAIRHAQAARGWATSIGYHPEVKDKLSDAITALNSAVDLIGVFEE